MKATESAAQVQTVQVPAKRGKPLRPSAPLVTLWTLVSTTRMISAKPSVAMAR